MGISKYLNQLTRTALDGDVTTETNPDIMHNSSASFNAESYEEFTDSIYSMSAENEIGTGRKMSLQAKILARRE